MIGAICLLNVTAGRLAALSTAGARDVSANVERARSL
jgi:hypothetical protein